MTRCVYVNAEKKLKEWKSEAKERELEKTAEEFLKKRKKVEEEDSDVAVDMEKFRNDSLLAREKVAASVTDGLVEARKLARRKRTSSEKLNFIDRCCSRVIQIHKASPLSSQ
ncbi:hypothetical protein Mapa_008594 [Marchantia paleacea]|nr:hypothetical protein Mapa_008594 [Marchantia paleacea]